MLPPPPHVDCATSPVLCVMPSGEEVMTSHLRELNVAMDSPRVANEPRVFVEPPCVPFRNALSSANLWGPGTRKRTVPNRPYNIPFRIPSRSGGTTNVAMDPPYVVNKPRVFVATSSVPFQVRRHNEEIGSPLRYRVVPLPGDNIANVGMPGRRRAERTQLLSPCDGKAMVGSSQWQTDVTSAKDPAKAPCANEFESDQPGSQEIPVVVCKEDVYMKCQAKVSTIRPTHSIE